MNIIFAIYYKGICQYIDYTKNLTRRIREFKNQTFYKNKLVQKDASETFIHFQNSIRLNILFVKF